MWISLLAYGGPSCRIEFRPADRRRTDLPVDLLLCHSATHAGSRLARSPRIGNGVSAGSADTCGSPDRARVFVFRLAYHVSQVATAPFNRRALGRRHRRSRPTAASSVSYFCSSRSFLTNSTAPVVRTRRFEVEQMHLEQPAAGVFRPSDADRCSPRPATGVFCDAVNTHREYPLQRRMRCSIPQIECRETE